MKRLYVVLLLAAAAFAWHAPARAVPVACIVCGSTNLGPSVISYAVISGQSFLNEVAFHNIGFFGAVPGGSLDAIPNNTAPTDFVYLYQLANFGPPVNDYTVAGSAITAANLTGGGRLESTLFVDPGIGIVSPGPAGATAGLSGGPTIDFINGLNGANWGPCLGSGAAGINCSDATANLFAGAVQGINFGETPLAPLLDPAWTSSVMWFSSALGPGAGIASMTDLTGVSFSGFAPVPVPETGTLVLFAVAGLAAMIASRRRPK